MHLNYWLLSSWTGVTWLSDDDVPGELLVFVPAIPFWLVVRAILFWVVPADLVAPAMPVESNCHHHLQF